MPCWARSSGNGAYVTLIFYDANWVPVGSQRDFPFPGTGTWVAQAGTFVAPGNAVRVGIVPLNSATGTFWFDDLALSLH